MAILKKLKSEIMMLSPDDYKNAMLMRFGLTDGKNHSREDVCNVYNIDSETAIQLEKEIIKKVFKDL